jgi:hypothetical protein
MQDEFQPFRQPLVTATGILLAFLLNVAGGWAGKAFTTSRMAEYFVAISVCVPIPLYVAVLYRILRMDYPREKFKAYYRRTLFLFLTAIVISYLSMLAIIVESIVT